MLARGLMAGNLFDLGSRATVASEAEANAEFLRTRDRQPPRPWFRDNVDRWWQRWDDRPYRHAVCFVDNAGGDIVLGCLPLARWMLAHEVRVTLAANTGPALNDITATELTPLLARCAATDPCLTAALRDGRLMVAATGSTTPLLDLTDLNADFVALTADADLIHLHGMGRGIESNFHVPFTCDTLTTAVLKDEAVATHLGGGVFDCVFRFEPAR
jgi:type II pantothenate kinase